MTVKVTIGFQSWVTVNVDPANLDGEHWNLTDPDEYEEAVMEWCAENASPGVYYQDYSGQHSMICVKEGAAVGASYEVAESDWTFQIGNGEDGNSD
jgi:hypothetical protein